MVWKNKVRLGGTIIQIGRKTDDEWDLGKCLGEKVRVRVRKKRVAIVKEENSWLIGFSRDDILCRGAAGLFLLCAPLLHRFSP